MKKVKYFKAVTRKKDSSWYESHLFKGYPSLKYVKETLMGNGLKVNSLITIDEEFYNQEIKTNQYLVWDRTIED